MSKPQKFRSRVVAAVMAASLLGAVGCSRSGPEAYPVEFEVQVRGMPAAGATVVLHPVGKADRDTPLPTGRVDDTGAVRLSTFGQDDGAPPGEYTVTVRWHDVTATADQPMAVSPADKLKGRYARPDAPAAPRVTVGKRPNKLPALQL